MRQTWAVFLDAYRELNAKKLFWITMAISALVVAAFAVVSLTPNGMKVLVWEFDMPVFNSRLLSNASFYKLMFQSLGIEFWLTWIATIIALIATCSMIPDFVAGGSIELTLSKPIGRVRLFLTKYAAGLLFTLMQVLVFSSAVFLLIGIRGGEWQPKVFLAVPIVTLAYSYLFSVCALVGLLTRSAIFSLIATLLVWLLVFAVDVVESGVMLSLRTQSEVQVERARAAIERHENPAAAEEAAPGAEKKPEGLLGRAASMFKPKPPTVSPAKLKYDLAKAEEALEKWQTWHRVAFAIKTVLPKTGETTGLLARSILPESELSTWRADQMKRAEENQQKFRATRAERRGQNAEEIDDEPSFADPRVAVEMEKRINERSVMWVIGTSLAFEGVLLGIACAVFRRRDF